MALTPEQRVDIQAMIDGGQATIIAEVKKQLASQAQGFSDDLAKVTKSAADGAAVAEEVKAKLVGADVVVTKIQDDLKNLITTVEATKVETAERSKVGIEEKIKGLE